MARLHLPVLSLSPTYASFRVRDLGTVEAGFVSLYSGGTGYAYGHIALPADYSAATGFTVVYTAESTTGDFDLVMGYRAVDAAEDLDGAYTTAESVTASMPGTADYMVEQVFDSTLTGMAANDMLVWRLQRSGAADASSDECDVLGIYLDY